VFREIGAGICGYLAGLPVYFGVAIIVVGITWAISHLTGGSEPRAVGNRLTDVLEGGTPWELAVIFMLATIWAPVVEESIFRGCLFRHLRRRVGLILAALGSAAVFAALHGYLVQQLFMVAALGFWFALMREWRGNIIATATAHALHNGFVMSIVLFTLSFARG
jgi:membrane protease YdiL (CAAX protease family)